MHIVIILRDITESGGGERVCVNLANAFSLDCGYRVTIISLFHANNAPVYDVNSSINTIALSFNKSFMQSKGIKKLLHKTYTRFYTNLQAHNILVRLKPDIVIANDGTFIPIKKLANTRYIRIWHLDIPKKAKLAFRRFDSIVILTSANIALWQRLHNSVFVIPNFLSYLPDRLTNHDNNVVLAIGRLSSEKGFSRLLDIYSLIYKDMPNWRLVIVGDGELKDALQYRIKALHLQDYVTLAGFKKDIESMYLSASICVSTSIFEGFGMSLAEASSYALVPLAFNISGPSDIIADSDLLIENNNNVAFAEKLKSLMIDKNTRESKGMRARLYIINHFSKERVLTLWKECLFNNKTINT